jgi:hypothetical protein
VASPGYQCSRGTSGCSITGGISFDPLLSDQSQIVFRGPQFLFLVFLLSVGVHELSAVLFLLSDLNTDYEC